MHHGADQRGLWQRRHRERGLSEQLHASHGPGRCGRESLSRISRRYRNQRPRYDRVELLIFIRGACELELRHRCLDGNRFHHLRAVLRSRLRLLQLYARARRLPDVHPSSDTNHQCRQRDHILHGRQRGAHLERRQRESVVPQQLGHRGCNEQHVHRPGHRELLRHYDRRWLHECSIHGHDRHRQSHSVDADGLQRRTVLPGLDHRAFHPDRERGDVFVDWSEWLHLGTAEPDSFQRVDG